jgi:hypothetical protein
MYHHRRHWQCDGFNGVSRRHPRRCCLLLSAWLVWLLSVAATHGITDRILVGWLFGWFASHCFVHTTRTANYAIQVVVVVVAVIVVVVAVIVVVVAVIVVVVFVFVVAVIIVVVGLSASGSRELHGLRWQ